jgi:cobalt/nickel transport system permease protein
MALPAVICFYLFAPLMHKNQRILLLGGFGCGFCAVLFGAVIVGLSLMFTEENFLAVATLVATAHIPVMIIEGIVTAFCVVFLKKVQPAMLP